MTTSVFDHPFLSGLLGDAEIAACFSVEADIGAMLAFEAALARSEARFDLVPADAAARIRETCAVFAADIERLKTATATDGVVVPELVRQLRDAVGGTAADHVHFGATSQDVIDTGLMLRLKTVFSILAVRVARLAAALDER